MSKRAENGWELLPILNETFSTKTFYEWDEIFRRADLIFGRVNRLFDLLRDPQIEANQYIYDYDHPVLGRIKWLGFPFEMLGTPLVMTRDAPEVGQHTEEILLEEGYTWSDIENLQDLEVI
jgi:crotonobetainyl-CoA:carnitine CoA-transferase CaiB-like acyl-CoA transferase